MESILAPEEKIVFSIHFVLFRQQPPLRSLKSNADIATWIALSPTVSQVRSNTLCLAVTAQISLIANNTNMQFPFPGCIRSCRCRPQSLLHLLHSFFQFHLYSFIYQPFHIWNQPKKRSINRTNEVQQAERNILPYSLKRTNYYKHASDKPTKPLWLVHSTSLRMLCFVGWTAIITTK